MAKKKRPMKEVLQDLLDLSGELHGLDEYWGSEQLSILWATLDGHGWEDITDSIVQAGREHFKPGVEDILLSGNAEALDQALDLVDDAGVRWGITKFEYMQEWRSDHWFPIIRVLLERRGPREWSPREKGRYAGYLIPAKDREEEVEGL